ncbi:tetratricopeptide repeat protein [Myxococcota bacterium]|nr:tetratricopeptide repeat protein [Myxococcota bacterium]
MQERPTLNVPYEGYPPCSMAQRSLRLLLSGWFASTLWIGAALAAPPPTPAPPKDAKAPKAPSAAKIEHPSIQDPRDRALTELLADRKADQAIKQIEGLLKDKAGRTPLRVFLLGRALLQKKRYAQAAAAFLEVAQNKDKNNFFAEKAAMLVAEAHAQDRDFAKAQKIYGDAVRRFLSPAHRTQLAGMYLRYAQKYLGQAKEQPNQQHTLKRKAATFFSRALELELPQDQAQSIRLALGQVYLDLSDYQARSTFEEARKIEKKGKLADAFTFFFAKALEQQSNPTRARILWQDFLRDFPRSERAPEAHLALAENYLRLAYSRKLFLDLGVDALHRLAKQFPSHKLARTALYRVGEVFFQHRRYKEAQAAFQTFVNQFARAAAPEGDRLMAQARYHIAMSAYHQGHEEESIRSFSTFLQEHPTDSLWPQAQRLIITARYQIAEKAYKKKLYAKARAHYEDFFKQYPLDGRAAMVMWQLAQIEVAQKHWQPAIDAYARLHSKYPYDHYGYRSGLEIGKLYEVQIKDYEKAIKAYEKVQGWPFRSQAQAAIQRLKRKELTLHTPRIFNTHEEGHLFAEVRNLKKLSVKMYKVDAETYFRKMHRFGGMDALDIELIRPDKEWEITLKGRRYEQVKQKITLPEKAPMIALLHVSGGGLQATSIAIRSDLQIVSKMNRETIFVFAIDQRLRKPLAGVQLLISSGSKILYEAKTGPDGSYRLRDRKLRKHTNLHVLALHQGSVAASHSLLTSLPFHPGLTYAGLIYTDRSVYLPGERVQLKAILREVKHNQYSVPTRPYTLTIANPDRQEIFRQILRPNALGTLHTHFQSDANAPLGNYTVTLHRKRGPTFTGSFDIRHYTLPRYLLSIDAKRKVYVRGETIQGHIAARYGFGAPAANQHIFYTFADRTYKGKTDAKGQLAFTLPTRELDIDRSFSMRAEIQGEQAHASTNFWLQGTLFSLSLKTLRKIYAAGERFHLSITAKDRADQPYAANIRLSWVRLAPEGEKPLGQAVVSVGKDGKGSHSLTVSQGGQILVRAQTNDAQGHPISVEHRLYISGQEDKQVLRLLSDRDRYFVGETIQVRLLSRRTGPALLTWESNGIFKHEFLPVLQKGERLFKFEAEDALGANFAFHVTQLEGIKMHTAHTVFALQRFLKVHITPRQKEYAPGQIAEVEIRTTDQSGKPVAAELSVAAIDELLLSFSPDTTPRLEDIFYKAQHRLGMITQASSTFTFRALSKLIPQTLLLMQPNLDPTAGDGSRPEGSAAATSNGYYQRRGSYGQNAYGGLRSRRYRRYRRYPSYQQRFMPRQSAYNKQILNNEIQRPQAFELNSINVQGRVSRPDTSVLTGKDGQMQTDQMRQRFASTAYWQAALHTDQTGRLVIKMPLPENTTTWRIIARGIAKPLLVGQGEGRLTVRKEVFGELKLPLTLTEGDRFQPRAVLHNQSQQDVHVRATLALQALGQIRTVTLKMPAGTSKEVFFGEVSTDGAGDKELQATLTVIGVLGDQPFELPKAVTPHKRWRDASAQMLRIIPQGVEVTTGAAGILSERTTHALQLPADGDLRHIRFQIRFGTHTPAWLLHIAEKQPSAAGVPGLLLLRAVSLAAALRYLDAQQQGNTPQSLRLRAQLEQLFRALLPRQYSNGGWGFTDNTASSFYSALAYITLQEAAQKKWVQFDLSDPLRKVLQYLQNDALPSTNDDFNKLVILYAMAHANTDASTLFTYINQFLRRRSRLSLRNLASLSLLLAKLERFDLCAQLIAPIAAKMRAAQKPLAPRHSSLYPIRPIYGVALYDVGLAIEALSLIAPTHAALEEGVRWLLGQRRGRGWASMYATTQAIRALFAYYQHFPAQTKPTRVAIHLNGKLWKEVTLSQDVPAQTLKAFHLPNQGRVHVSLVPEGNAKLHYAAQLSGFTTKPDASLYKGAYRINRYVTAAPLQIDGRTITSGFGVLAYGTFKPWRQAVQELPWAETANVQIDIYRRSGENEEIILEEALPGGAYVSPASIKLSDGHYSIERGKIRFFLYPSSGRHHAIHYQLSGIHPGQFHQGHTSVRSFAIPQRLSLGRPSKLTILSQGQQPSTQRRLTPDEDYTIGMLHFSAGRLEAAEKHLRPLLERYTLNAYPLKHTARALLSIALKRGPNHALIKSFEILKDRFPDTELSFAEILQVGHTYAEQGEYERAFMVFQATLAALFLQEIKVAKTLEEEGEFAAASSFIESLWRRYPDLRVVQETFYALAQSVYQFAEKCKSKPLPVQRHWLQQAEQLFARFVWMYPTHPSADIAAYSRANILMEQEQRPAAIRYLKHITQRYPQSTRLAGMHYLQAYAHYLELQYTPALQLLQRVSQEHYPDGKGSTQKSVDRFLARYLIAQIYHAQQQYKQALVWYRKIQTQFPDADAQSRYLSQIQLRLPEVTTLTPNKPPRLQIKHQNVQQATLLAYYVDLMKLYLLKKDLSTVTRINLAGIRPTFQKQIQLGTNEEFALRTTSIDLPLTRLGAYLLVLKSKDREVSGIVLRSSLHLDVQQDPSDGRVTLHLQKDTSLAPVPKALTRVVGSTDGQIRSGRTDLRGIYTVEGVRGLATIIAQYGDEYAFFRGKQFLGQPTSSQTTSPYAPTPTAAPRSKFDALENVRSGNWMLQKKGRIQLDRLYQQEQRGVQLKF